MTIETFNLGVPFVLKARELGVEYVAFLLRSTWWQWKIWPPSVIYALTFRLDFEELGSPTMECSWMIWEAKSHGETIYRRMGKAPDHRQGSMLEERP